MSQQISSSKYFDLAINLHSYQEIEKEFKKGTIKFAVVFPQNFGKDLLHINKTQVQLIADASDPNVATTLTNYATAIIMAHNHPSGKLEPSQADITITKSINKCGDILNINLIDHLIVTRNGYYSFSDEGKLF